MFKNKRHFNCYVTIKKSWLKDENDFRINTIQDFDYIEFKVEYTYQEFSLAFDYECGNGTQTHDPGGKDIELILISIKQDLINESLDILDLLNDQGELEVREYILQKIEND
jgi:hypothetical protein